MGMPALDIIALETAIQGYGRSAAEILDAGPITLTAAANDRSKLSQVVGQLEREFEAWCTAVDVALANLRSALEASLTSMPLPIALSVTDQLSNYLRSSTTSKTDAERLDDRLVALFAHAATDAGSHDDLDQGLVDYEMKRIERIRDGRTMFLRKLNASIRQMIAFIESWIADNSVPAAQDSARHTSDRPIEHVLDTAEVQQRTRDLLARFPRTAAYLAR